MTLPMATMAVGEGEEGTGAEPRVVVVVVVAVAVAVAVAVESGVAVVVELARVKAAQQDGRRLGLSVTGPGVARWRGVARGGWGVEGGGEGRCRQVWRGTCRVQRKESEFGPSIKFCGQRSKEGRRGSRVVVGGSISRLARPGDLASASYLPGEPRGRERRGPSRVAYVAPPTK